MLNIISLCLACVVACFLLLFGFAFLSWGRALQDENGSYPFDLAFLQQVNLKRKEESVPWNLILLLIFIGWVRPFLALIGSSLALIEGVPFSTESASVRLQEKASFPKPRPGLLLCRFPPGLGGDH